MAKRFPISFAAALPWAFLFGGWALYGWGAARGLSILDSGEFLGAAATMGVAHPTGYPLYMLAGRLAALVPGGDAAFFINLVSAAAGAGAAFFMALAAAELTREGESGVGRVAAIVAAGLLTLSARTLWSVATMAEVYALNAFFWAALLWAALKLRRTGAARELYVLALVMGLALANHMTVVLFFPAILLIGWPGRARVRTLGSALPVAAALFLGGVSVNLYTALRAAQQPLFNWNDPSTLGSLYAHLAGFQYRGNFLGDGPAGVWEALGQYRASVLANVTPAALLAAPALAWLWVRRYRLFAVAAVLYYVVYMAYCAVYSIPDIYYYFIPLHLLVTALTAVGAAAVASALGRRLPALGRVGGAAVLIIVVAAGGWALVSNFDYGRRRGYLFAERYGRELLKTLPARALFFPSGDTNTFLIWYNVYARGLRPDVAIVDQIRLPSRGYLTSLARRYPDLALPDEREIRLRAELAVARGDFTDADVVFGSSDDFILPEILAGIIADNAGKRRMFWGLGDPGKKLQSYFVPHELAFEIVTEEPPAAEIRRRAESAVAALTGIMAEVERDGPAELHDPFFKKLVAVYYSGLSGHLAYRGIFAPQEELFESYIRLVPGDVNGYQNLASIYMVGGRAEEAAEYYRRALEIAPANGSLRARLALALFAAGRGEEAAEIAAGLEAGENGEAGYVRAIILREQGKVEEALEEFEAAAPYYAEDPEFWWERAVTFDAAGDYRAAGEAYGRALEFNPYNARVFTARGVNYLKRGKATSAVEDFEAAIELDPGEAQAHYNLACVYSLEGATARALEHLAAAVQLNPERYGAMAREDPDLTRCRELPEFEEIVTAAAESGREP